MESLKILFSGKSIFADRNRNGIGQNQKWFYIQQRIVKYALGKNFSIMNRNGTYYLQKI